MAAPPRSPAKYDSTASRISTQPRTTGSIESRAGPTVGSSTVGVAAAVRKQRKAGREVGLPVDPVGALVSRMPLTDVLGFGPAAGLEEADGEVPVRDDA